MTLPLLKPVTRRRYSVEYKLRLVELCQPGISITGVALTHGINPNLLRRWIRSYRTSSHSFQVIQTQPSVQMFPSQTIPSQTVQFIPATVPANTVHPNRPQQSTIPLDNTSVAMIELTLTGGAGNISLRWPVADAAALVPVLKALL